MKIYENLKYSDDYEVCMGFADKASSKITLHPNTVAVYESAFKNCTELKKVNFNKKLSYIRPYAFSGTSLENLYLPKSINIKKEAFSHIDTFKDVKIETIIPVSCFTGSKIKNLEIYSKEIGHSSFESADIGSLKIEDTLLINPSAFYKCKFKDEVVILPESLNTIYLHAFALTNLKKIILPKHLEVCHPQICPKDATIIVVDENFYKKNINFFKDQNIEFLNLDTLLDTNKSFKEINTFLKDKENTYDSSR